MSACMEAEPDERKPYYRDYTETMESDTLFKIRDSLKSTPQINFSSSWQSKRLKRINQVLRERGFKNMHL